MAIRTLIAILLAGGALAHEVTPIEKVTQLLKGLQTKIEAEGKKEAAAYDKYACFCKEQADGKLYAIEKSDATIAKLTAEIKALDADIVQLNGDVSKLNKKVSELDENIDKKTKSRKADHEKYLAKANDLSEAIAACEGAIDMMEEAKGNLKDAKVDLIQVHRRLLNTASRQTMSASAIALIEKLGIGQSPPKYQFQGNDLIATLNDLLATFKDMKKDIDFTEFDTKSVFDKETLGMSTERQFAEKEKTEREALADQKTDEVMDAKESNDEEKKDRAADQEFLDVLTKECEEKAKLWDQRSSTRSNELTAMTKAIELLESGVAPNEKANKKLVGLVQGDLAPSFIQTVLLNQDASRATRKVQELLQDASSRLDSSVLKAAAVRVQVSEDHFVKVRGLIKDLIAKLKADAKAEAEQKSFCDKAMKKAITGRDDAMAKMEAASAKIASLQSKKDTLTEDIHDLNDKIAENSKALSEATELRSQEKGDNEETISSAEAGYEAVKMALNVLEGFYKTAFVQYVPPKSGRDGKTVDDLAPDAGFDEDYHGAQAESKGILGILEVISSDFERTIKKTKSDEKAAQDEFSKMEKEANADTKAKASTVKTKEGQLAKAESDLLDEQQGLKDATDVHDSAKDKLDDLEVSCVEGEETFEERAAKRKAEIEALKEAQTVLEEWQGF